MTDRCASNLQVEDDLDGGVADHEELGAELGVAPTIRIAAVEPLAVGSEEAAALIGVSRTAFYKLATSGRIGPVGVRLGKHVRFSLAELRDWAAAGMPPRHEWAARQGRNGGLK